MKEEKKKSASEMFLRYVPWERLVPIVLLLGMIGMISPGFVVWWLVRWSLLVVIFLKWFPHRKKIKKWWKDKTAAAAAAVGGAGRLNFMIIMLVILILSLFVRAIETIFGYLKIYIFSKTFDLPRSSLRD